jgi:hypothetical protein
MSFKCMIMSRDRSNWRGNIENVVGTFFGFGFVVFQPFSLLRCSERSRCEDDESIPSKSSFSRIVRYYNDDYFYGIGMNLVCQSMLILYYGIVIVVMLPHILRT